MRKKLLADINEEESLLGQPLPTIEKIHKIAAHKEAIRMYEMEGFELKSVLSNIDGKIGSDYLHLYMRETIQITLPDAGRKLSIKESMFWDEIMKLKDTNTSELRLESLKKEIDIFEANLRANTLAFEASDSLLQMSRGAKRGDEEIAHRTSG